MDEPNGPPELNDAQKELLKRLASLLEDKERHDEDRREPFLITRPISAEIGRRREQLLEELADVDWINEAFTKQRFRRRVVDFLATRVYGDDLNVRVVRSLQLRDVLEWRREHE